MDYRIKPGTAIKSRLALKLVRDRVLPGNAVQAALGRQIIYGGCLDTVLLELGSLQESDIWTQLVAATGLPAPEPAMLDQAGPHLAEVVDADRAARAGIVPLGRDEDTLIAICTELVQISSVRELATELGMKIALYVVPELRLELARHAVYGEAIAGRFLHLLTILEGPEQARHTLASIPALSPVDGPVGDAAEAPAPPAEAQMPPEAPVAPPPAAISTPDETEPGSFDDPEPSAAAERFAEPPPGTPARAPAARQDEPQRDLAGPAAGHGPSPAAADETGARPASAAAPAPAAPSSNSAAAAAAAGRASSRGQVTPAAAADIPGAEARDAILDSLVAAAISRVSFAAVLGISGHGDERTARARSVGAAGTRPIRINGAVLGLAEPSPLSVVAESGTPYLGPLGDSQIARALAEDLGRSPVGSVMLLPVTIARRVVCLLYADQGQSASSIDDMEALSIYAGQAAVELSRVLRAARTGRTEITAQPLPSPVAPTDPAIRAVPAAQPAEPQVQHGGDERTWDEGASGPHAPETDDPSTPEAPPPEDPPPESAPPEPAPSSAPAETTSGAASGDDGDRVEPAVAAEAAVAAPEMGATDQAETPVGEAGASVDDARGAEVAPLDGPGAASATAELVDAPDAPFAAGEAAGPAAAAAPDDPPQSPAGADASDVPPAEEEQQLAAPNAVAPATSSDEGDDANAQPAPDSSVAAGSVGPGGPTSDEALVAAGPAPVLVPDAAAPSAAVPTQHTMRYSASMAAIPDGSAHPPAARATIAYGQPTPTRPATAAGPTPWPARVTEPDDSEFCKLAANPDTAVRTSALRTLRRRLDHPEVRTFCTQMRVQARSPSPSEALTAIIALGELRDPDAVPVLIDQLRSFDASVTEAARVALTTIAKQDFGTSRWRWSGWWRRCRGQHRIEWLIEGLSNKDPEIRFSASEELGLLTGEYFGYHFDLPKRQRDEAVRRWQEWWKLKGRKRFSRLL